MQTIFIIGVEVDPTSDHARYADRPRRIDFHDPDTEAHGIIILRRDGSLLHVTVRVSHDCLVTTERIPIGEETE